MRTLSAVASLFVCLATAGVVGQVDLAAAAGTSVATEHLGVVEGAQQTCVLEPSADSEVREQFPTTNYGTSVSVFVAPKTAERMRGFLQFDTSSCAGLGASSTVLSGDLKLYVVNAPFEERTHELKRVAANWSETTVTWNNQPAVTNAATDSQIISTTSAVYVTFDGTVDVKAWVAGTAINNGWRVSDAAENTLAQPSVEYQSSEIGTPSFRPELTIVYL